MAKILKYKILVNEINNGTEENPNMQQIFASTTLSWSESNEEVAKREAYNGEYTIVDDGKPEPEIQPTTDDVLNVLLGVTA